MISLPTTAEPCTPQYALNNIYRLVGGIASIHAHHLPDLTVSTCADLTCDTDPFAEADADTGETKQSQNYIHIRIQRECTPSSQPSPHIH